MEDVLNLIWFVVLVGLWVLSKLGKARKDERAEKEWTDALSDEDWPDLAGDDGDDGDDDGDGIPDIYDVRDGGAVPVAARSGQMARTSGGDAPEVADPYAGPRRALLAELDALERDMSGSTRAARNARATAHIAEAIDAFVRPRLRAVRSTVASGTGPIHASIHHIRDDLGLVHAAGEMFVNQRQAGPLALALGDVDAIARGCYQPLLEFARANRVPLASAQPVAVLTPFDLATWTGFIPTGLAPLFLPPTFFDDIRWWPALAHEIAHDFLAGTDADDRLRDELGVASEEVGTRPIAMSARGLSVYEIWRVFGAWFEELFCDIAGTMMLGPAYGYTMVELFTDRQYPRRTATVSIDRTGRRYDVHPPRHLRVLTCARVLELVGEHEAAGEIRQVWTDRHGQQDTIAFPVAGGSIGLPTDQIMQIAGGVAESLYSTSLQAFDGHALRDIPGLDWGTHRAAEARRARDEMLSGRAPTGHKPISVVAGAVLAWWRAREREAEFIALARRAIAGVTESRADVHAEAYGGGRARHAHDRAHARPATRAARMRESFLLHVVLSPPPSVARMRPGANGFIGRRQWPPKPPSSRMSGSRTFGVAGFPPSGSGAAGPATPPPSSSPPSGSSSPPPSPSSPPGPGSQS